MSFDENEESLIYGCRAGERILWLEVTFRNERVSAWRMYTDTRMDAGNMDNRTDSVNMHVPTAAPAVEMSGENETGAANTQLSGLS